MRCSNILPCAVLLGCISGSGAWGQATDIVKSVGTYRFPLEKSGAQIFLPFEASSPIDQPGKFAKLVLFIPGVDRGVTVSPAMQTLLGVSKRRDTLLFVPQFLKDRDREAYKLPDNIPSWPPSSEWAWGGLSSGSQRISSFEAVDQIIAQMIDSYPSVREVIVIGHSAGGQFTQRYAVLSPLEDHINAGKRHIAFKYLISSPASYLYFDNRRVSASGMFEVPPSDAVANCPKYNFYGYGLDDPNSYAKATTRAEIERRLLSRSIAYFIGDDDVDEEHPTLDKNCRAEMQGRQRYQRARNYWNHLVDKFGPDALVHQTMICIPHGVHDRMSTVWDTACGRFYLSGIGSCRPTACPDK